MFVILVAEMSVLKVIQFSPSGFPVKDAPCKPFFIGYLRKERKEKKRKEKKES